MCPWVYSQHHISEGELPVRSEGTGENGLKKRIFHMPEVCGNLVNDSGATSTVLFNFDVLGAIPILYVSTGS